MGADTRVKEALDEADAYLLEAGVSFTLISEKGNDTMQGEIYHQLERNLRRIQTAAPADSAVRSSYADLLGSFEAGWSLVQEAAWMFVWERREQTLFAITFLGIRLVRWTWGDLRKAWAKAFGPCPFPWDSGPPALVRDA